MSLFCFSKKKERGKKTVKSFRFVLERGEGGGEDEADVVSALTFEGQKVGESQP